MQQQRLLLMKIQRHQEKRFQYSNTYAAGLDMGNIPAGQHYAIWYRRTVSATAAAIDNDSITLKVDCDTGS